MTNGCRGFQFDLRIIVGSTDVRARVEAGNRAQRHRAAKRKSVSIPVRVHRASRVFHRVGMVQGGGRKGLTVGISGLYEKSLVFGFWSLVASRSGQRPIAKD